MSWFPQGHSPPPKPPGAQPAPSFRRSPGSSDLEILEERLLALLSGSAPLTRDSLRERLSVRNERLGRALERLVQSGAIERTTAGWKLSETTASDRSAFPSIGMNGNGTIDDPPGVADHSDDSFDRFHISEEESPF